MGQKSKQKQQSNVKKEKLVPPVDVCPYFENCDVRLGRAEYLARFRALFHLGGKIHLHDYCMGCFGEKCIVYLFLRIFVSVCSSCTDGLCSIWVCWVVKKMGRLYRTYSLCVVARFCLTGSCWNICDFVGRRNIYRVYRKRLCRIPDSDNSITKYLAFFRKHYIHHWR